MKYIFFVFIAAFFSILQAGIITINDFQGTQIVSTFDTFPALTGAVVYNGNTYTTDDSHIRHNSSWGATIGGTTYAISNNTDTGFIDVVLGAPALRVGGLIGTVQAWTATVSFYDTSNNLINTQNLSGNANQGKFVGFQADSGLIQRIHIHETSANGVVFMLENFTTEATGTPVPEQTTFAFVFFSLMALYFVKSK